jgi:hypothetical protein
MLLEERQLKEMIIGYSSIRYRIDICGGSIFCALCFLLSAFCSGLVEGS